MLHSRMMRSALFPTGGLNAPPRPLAIACGRSPAARPQSPVMREIDRTGGLPDPVNRGAVSLCAAVRIFRL